MNKCSGFNIIIQGKEIAQALLLKKDYLGGRKCLIPPRRKQENHRRRERDKAHILRPHPNENVSGLIGSIGQLASGIANNAMLTQ